MKKILICAIALFCLTTSTTAQTAKEVQKQRKEIYKMSKEELNQKATKDARKAAKEYNPSLILNIFFHQFLWSLQLLTS